MRPFVGFKRKAVVVLPTDKVFRERIDKRTKEEGKEVPETAVLEMKGRRATCASREYTGWQREAPYHLSYTNIYHHLSSHFLFPAISVTRPAPDAH